LVQEPEIHLHTDAQLAMADFLVDLSKQHGMLLLRTAYGVAATIYSEDNHVLQAAACIQRKFNVRTADPSS
jgi:hypothetical protein